MRKVWLLARHEYRRMVRRRSFLLGTLGVPLIIIVVMVISIAVSVGGDDDRPIGCVDLSGVLSPAGGLRFPLEGRERAVDLRLFADVDAAYDALVSEEIQAYYVLPADYVQSGKVQLYFWDSPPSEWVRDQFSDLLRVNLVAGMPAAVQQRAISGTSLTVRSVDGRREINSQDWLSFVVPFAAGFFFVISVMSSAGYLLQAVTTEKENRTMEVMITSMTPDQMIVGKALGLMSVSLTQIAIWAVAVGIGLAVGSQFWPILRTARVPWGSLGIVALYFLPAFALVAGLMTTIGSAVTETRQGQQIASIINLVFSAPFFFLAVILTNPNSPVLVALTLFPPTAFITIAMRWSLTVVPLWQLALSWVLLVLSAMGSVWISGRVLRAGMLRYGQRLSLRGVVRAIRGMEPAG